MLLLTLSHQSAAASGPSILVLGDSLSAAYGMDMEQGWVNLLEQRLKVKAPNTKVINASISGETTGGGAARLAGLLDKYEPSVVIIELGGNDGLRAYPIKQMRRNLQTMTDAALSANSKVLLLAAEAPPNLGRRYTALFRESYTQLAQSEAVMSIPFIVEHIFLSDELMQADATHPNAKAQPLLLDVVWPSLLTLLGNSIDE